MKRRILFILLILGMCMTALPQRAMTVTAAEGSHSHDGIVFEEWTDTERLPNIPGNYCLTTDIEMPTDYNWNAPIGETNLCLHGHNISKPKIGKGGSAIGIGAFNYMYDPSRIPDPTTLNIFDCSEENPGTISGWNGPIYVRDGTLTTYNVNIHSDRDDNIIYLADNTSGTVTINGGKISSNSDNDGTAVITSKCARCSVTINGAEIVGYNGILNSGKLTINEGTVITANGGSALTNCTYLGDGDDDEYGYGDVLILGGSFTSDGDTIVNNGKMIISGGTFTSYEDCGIYNVEAYDDGVFDYAEGDLTLVEGTVTIRAARNGIYNDGNLKMSGGDVRGGGTYFSLFNSSLGRAEISGGTILHTNTDCVKNMGELRISGGTLKSEKGAGVYNVGGTLNVSGGNISGSSYGIYHGNNNKPSDPAAFILSGDPVITGAKADLNILRDKYITIIGKLSGTDPYSLAMTSPGVFTNSTDAENNDPEHFTSTIDGYGIIKNEDNQLALAMKTYTITYDRGEKGAGAVEAQTKIHDTDIELSSDEFTRRGYKQTGWATMDEGEKVYELGETYTENASVTLYPYWELTHEHEWDEGEVTKAPTEKSEGEKTYHCSGCDETKKEVLERLPSGPGNVEKETQSGDNAPDVDLAMDVEEMADIVFTDEDQQAVEDGKDIKLLLTVENADNNVDEDDRQRITEGASNYTVGQYLDIELLKVVTDKDQNEETSNITTTARPIRIVIVIPESLKSEKFREYAVVRLHDGETALLKDLDENPNTVTIETDRFSTYAMVYIEKVVETPPSGGSGSSSTGWPQTTPGTTPGSSSTETPDDPSSEDPAETPDDPSSEDPAETPDDPSSEDPAETPGENSGDDKDQKVGLIPKLKVTQKGKKLQVKWGNVAEADGYFVYVQYCGKDFAKKPTKIVKNASVTKVEIAKIDGKILKLKKSFKVYVAAYKIIDGERVVVRKTVCGHIAGKENNKYTNAKNVKVTKSKITLKVGETAKIEAKTVRVDMKKKLLLNGHCKKYRYKSVDNSIVKVSKSGKITAVEKGTCSIYVFAQNGRAQKIRITVK